MDKQTGEHTIDLDFAPPKLPIAWIATTFVAPAFVIILPGLFSSENTDLKTLIIIALALLSVFLFISCFSVVLRLYDASFQAQVLKLSIAFDKKQINELREELEATRREIASIGRESAQSISPEKNP